jgi:hypothetical protein
MPRPAINDTLWAEMTATQKADAVRAGEATLRQTVAGLLEGPDELNRACQEVLSRADASLEELAHAQSSHRGSADKHSENDSIDDQVEHQNLKTINESEARGSGIDSDASHPSHPERITATKRGRLGLPRGYLARLHRMKGRRANE